MLERKKGFSVRSGRLPEYLRGVKGRRDEVRKIKMLLRCAGLHTVCESARCPNIAECFCRPTATFMILGNRCTRKCGFCGVDKGLPEEVDKAEPGRLAEAARKLGLKYVVVTSVTRDDLADGGASQFVEVIRGLRDELPGAGVEVLTPDFLGRRDCIAVIAEAGPDVFNHNMETVAGLYEKVRPGADYKRSLQVLKTAKAVVPGLATKSGLMVGLGERREEIYILMSDLVESGCEVLTIGQYLRPNKHCLPVQRYYEVEEFRELEEKARLYGIKEVFSGPLVRSSYCADEVAERMGMKAVSSHGE